MIIDKIENINLYFGLSERVDAALKFIIEMDFSKLTKGKNEIRNDEIFILKNEYETKKIEECQLEAHRNYLDIQIMVEGIEKVGYSFIDECQSTTDYDEVGDYQFFGNISTGFFEFKKGMFAIFFPSDLHMPGLMCGLITNVKKAVVKVKI